MRSDSDRVGVLYVATQKPKYLVEAIASATSLKRFCSELPVCLFTDLLDSPLSRAACFDDVRPIACDTAAGTDWGRGLRMRILSLPRSPFERTFHLDTDTRFLSGDISSLFDQLDEYEIGLVEDSPEVSIGVKHYGERMFNAGVILYRQCSAATRLFEEWQRLFLAQLDAHGQDPMPEIAYMSHIQDATARRKMMSNDQFALAQLLSPTRNALGIKVKSLDEAWNFARTFVGDTLDRPIHVEHGPHLKADAFSRNVKHAKPASHGDLTMRLIHNLASAYVDLKHDSPEQCLTILEDAIRSVPNQSLVQVPLAQEVAKRGMFQDACKHAESAILADPDCFAGFVELATSLFNAGDMEAAARCVLRCRSRFPSRFGILGLAQIIHGERPGLLSPELAEPDYDAFVMQQRLGLAPSLNQALIDFILQQQMLETEPPQGAPVNFFRSSALGQLAGPAVAAFKHEVKAAVQRYLSHIAGKTHLFVQNQPPKIGLACWGNVIGTGGYMPAHIHKNAWVSGVYYLRVPDSLSQSSPDHAGWIEFGRPPLAEYRYSFQPRVRRLQPMEGMLLLFPAHYWHGTLPTRSSEKRISFGFNVIAAGG